MDRFGQRTNSSLEATTMNSSIPEKSKLERFDEAFNIVLIITTVVAVFLPNTISDQYSQFAMQTLLFVLLATVFWVIAVLWGSHPGARITRLLGFQTAVIALTRTLTVIFAILPPYRLFFAFSYTFVGAEAVLPVVVLVAGGFYLGLRRAQVLLAFILGMGLSSVFIQILFMYPF
jgi:hypothetical protein